MKTNVTEFGNFGYNLIPIGIYVSGEILQAKSDQLIGDI